MGSLSDAFCVEIGRWPMAECKGEMGKEANLSKFNFSEVAQAGICDFRSHLLGL